MTKRRTSAQVKANTKFKKVMARAKKLYRSKNNKKAWKTIVKEEFKKAK